MKTRADSANFNVWFSSFALFQVSAENSQPISAIWLLLSAGFTWTTRGNAAAQAWQASHSAALGWFRFLSFVCRSHKNHHHRSVVVRWSRLLSVVAYGMTSRPVATPANGIHRFAGGVLPFFPVLRTAIAIDHRPKISRMWNSSTPFRVFKFMRLAGLNKAKVVARSRRVTSMSLCPPNVLNYGGFTAKRVITLLWFWKHEGKLMNGSAVSLGFEVGLKRFILYSRIQENSFQGTITK